MKHVQDKNILSLLNRNNQLMLMYVPSYNIKLFIFTPIAWAKKLIQS